MRIPIRVSLAVLATVLASCLLIPGCASDDPAAPPPGSGVGRGFPTTAPWVSFYGSSAQMGDLNKVAGRFRIINLDADPDGGNFTPAEITQLKAGGTNRVISYLNLGSCESFRSYWNSVPSGFISCKANTVAQLGPYGGYPDEIWMDLGNADYQHLILDYVAPRLVAQGVDGFFLDNLELIEHAPGDSNGPCTPSCRQGGLDLVRRLRDSYPNLLIVMQNATGDVTRLGTTGGRSFAALLDGISHEEVYAPVPDPLAESQLQAWKNLNLMPGEKAFWIATEDYVGNCSNTTAAQAAYTSSRGQGFSPYATDASGGQQIVCYWPF